MGPPGRAAFKAWPLTAFSAGSEAPGADLDLGGQRTKWAPLWSASLGQEPAEQVTVVSSLSIQTSSLPISLAAQPARALRIPDPPESPQPPSLIRRTDEGVPAANEK